MYLADGEALQLYQGRGRRAHNLERGGHDRGPHHGQGSLGGMGSQNTFGAKKVYESQISFMEKLGLL